MRKYEKIKRNKKIPKPAGCIAWGLCLMLSLSCLTGCSSASMSGEQQRSLVPYSLYGNHGDWEVSCVVRELTDDEKREQLHELEENWKAEEELLRAQEDKQKIYEQTKEQHELLRQELKEKKAYVSIISGVCRNSEMWGKTFDYQLSDEKNKKIVAGTQTASSEASQWYRSWQTETHTQYGLFIPPVQNAAMVLRIGEEEITIPLELSTNTEKMIN